MAPTTISHRDGRDQQDDPIDPSINCRALKCQFQSSTLSRALGSGPQCRQPVKLFHQTLNPYSGPWPIKRGFGYTVVGKVTLVHTKTSTIDGHSGSGGGAMSGTIVRYENANLS